MMKNMVKVRRGGVLPISVIMQMTNRDILDRIKEKLKKYPKKRLAVFYYNLLKDNLPRLRKTKQRKLVYPLAGTTSPWKYTSLPRPKRKTKRKFSRKQLAAQRLFAKRARAGTLRRR